MMAKINYKFNMEISNFNFDDFQDRFKKFVEDYINEKMRRVVIQLVQDIKKEEKCQNQVEKQ